MLDHQIAAIEKQIKSRLRLDPSYRLLETVYGIGEILAMTIRLETGEVGRFPQVGDYASYCRCVGSQRRSNDKKKGENNRHNGNKYLAWAYVEAAYGAARFYPQVRVLCGEEDRPEESRPGPEGSGSQTGPSLLLRDARSGPLNRRGCLALEVWLPSSATV